jgi:hypothetical protein
MSNQLRWTIPKELVPIIEEYKKERKEELILEGVTTDYDVVKQLVLKGLAQWLDKHPDLRDKYLLK